MIIQAILILLLFWLIFLIGPIWLLGLQTCRSSSWWHEEDKIQKYIEVSPRIAKLLIYKYIGHSTHIRTNIPALYNCYIINKFPTRLSVLGLTDYCVTAILSGWYGICITAYFWLGWYDNPMIPFTGILLIVHSILFGILNNWNSSRVNWEKYEVVSREEIKKRKHDKKS